MRTQIELCSVTELVRFHQSTANRVVKQWQKTEIVIQPIKLPSIAVKIAYTHWASKFFYRILIKNHNYFSRFLFAG